MVLAQKTSWFMVHCEYSDMRNCLIDAGYSKAVKGYKQHSASTEDTTCMLC